MELEGMFGIGLIVFSALCVIGVIFKVEGVTDAFYKSINTKTSFFKNLHEEHHKIIRNQVVKDILQFLYFKSETALTEIDIGNGLKLIKDKGYIIAATKKDGWRNGIGIYITSCYDAWCHNYCVVTDKSKVKHRESDSIPKEMIEQLYDDIYDNSDEIKKAVECAKHEEYYE